MAIAAMSVVDTAVVGSSSATELAALGPATMLTDSTAYLFFWLNVATTSLFATATASGKTREAYARRSRSIATHCTCSLSDGVLASARSERGMTR